jgi:putative hemolysin
MESIWVELVLIVVAILANGFFAGSEIALVSARASRLGQLRQAGVRGAATALTLKERPETFLATIQIAITLVGVLASAVGGATAVAVLTPFLVESGVSPAWARSLALGIVIVLITYTSLILGELTPKAIALRDPERIAAFVARPILWVSRLSGALVRLLTASTRGVLRLLGLGQFRASPFVSEEEVRYLVTEGAAKGIFEPVEQELVHNVFEFADTTVREIMVPRVDVRALDVETPAEEVLRAATAIGHSRIPVYRESIEHPVGVVVIKDLLRCAALGEAPALRALAHPPLFVPEAARISALLTEFQRTRQNLAMVVDEYGGVAGLVTVEDVLEEIVGELREERESVSPLLSPLPDGSYVVDAAAPIWEVREALGLPVAESPQYNTLAGYIIYALGTIPRPGASLVADGHRWTVVDVEGPRVTRVKIEREPR